MSRAKDPKAPIVISVPRIGIGHVWGKRLEKYLIVSASLPEITFDKESGGGAFSISKIYHRAATQGRGIMLATRPFALDEYPFNEAPHLGPVRMVKHGTFEAACWAEPVKNKSVPMLGSCAHAHRAVLLVEKERARQIHEQASKVGALILDTIRPDQL